MKFLILLSCMLTSWSALAQSACPKLDGKYKLAFYHGVEWSQPVFLEIKQTGCSDITTYSHGSYWNSEGRSVKLDGVARVALFKSSVGLGDAEQGMIATPDQTSSSKVLVANHDENSITTSELWGRILFTTAQKCDDSMSGVNYCYARNLTYKLGSNGNLAVELRYTGAGFDQSHFKIGQIYDTMIFVPVKE
jgi:hypothetical protein